MAAATSTHAEPRQSQYLTFVVGDTEYGIGILRAKEIIEYDTVTVVPNAPPFVRGVINLRGRVVSVVDLALRFGRTPSEVTRRSCIVVVEVDRDGTTDVVGIVADRVSQVVELPADAIEPAPPFGTGVRTDWLLGLGRADKRFVLLLDTDRMLSDWDDTGELAAMRDAAAAEAAGAEAARA